MSCEGARQRPTEYASITRKAGGYQAVSGRLGFEASGQDWEELGLTIAGRSLVIAVSKRQGGNLRSETSDLAVNAKVSLRRGGSSTLFSCETGFPRKIQKALLPFFCPQEYFRLIPHEPKTHPE